MELQRFLEVLPKIATQPLAILAYICLVGGWLLWFSRKRQSADFLKALDAIPRNERANFAQNAGYRYDELAQLSNSERMYILTRRYRLFAYITTLIGLVLILLSIIITAKEPAKPTVSVSQQAGHNSTQIGHVSGDVIFNQQIEHKKLLESQEPITLFTLFQTDFVGTDRTCVDWEPLKFESINKLSGQVEWQIPIPVRQCFDFAARSYFLALLIPSSPYTFTIAMYLSWEYKEVLSYVSVLALKSKSPGGEIVTSENMPFGSSIILYYEDALTYKQLGAIKEAFERNKINVQLRGQDYWQSQILQRAATRKP